MITDVTASTNDDAKAFAREMDKGLVIALSQSAGRGRYNREFFSIAGLGAYFSYFFRAGNDCAKYACISALAVVDTLRSFGLDTVIKWPNDVLANGRKICGILPESIFNGDCRTVIIGIGVNLNHRILDFPEPLQKNATSLFAETGVVGDPVDFAVDVSVGLENLMTHSPELVHREYAECSFLIGKRVELQDGKSARAVGIGDDYSLIIEYEDGSRENRIWGEVLGYSI